MVNAGVYRDFSECDIYFLTNKVIITLCWWKSCFLYLKLSGSNRWNCRFIIYWFMNYQLMSVTNGLQEIILLWLPGVSPVHVQLIHTFLVVMNLRIWQYNRQDDSRSYRCLALHVSVTLLFVTSIKTQAEYSEALNNMNLRNKTAFHHHRHKMSLFCPVPALFDILSTCPETTQCTKSSPQISYDDQPS